MTKEVFTTVTMFVTAEHGTVQSYSGTGVPIPRVGDVVTTGGHRRVHGVVESINYEYPDHYGPEPTMAYVRVNIKAQ